MNKKNKGLFLVISLIIILQSMFTAINYSYVSYAADNEFSILISGYFEYWQDPTTKKWLFDDSNNIRHSFPGPNDFIYNYNYNINIPSGYRLKKVVPFQHENAHINLQNWTGQDYDHIRRYKVNNMTIDNADSLIGETKVANAKVTFHVPHQNEAWEFPKAGITVYRHYMPIVLELEPLKNPDKVIIKYQDTNGKTLKPDDEAMELSKEGYNDVYPNETKHADLLAEGYALNSPKSGYHLVYNSNAGNTHIVIFIYNPPADAFITVTGTANPNPVMLSGGKGKTINTVKGEVFNLPSGVTIQSMKLFIQNNANSQWMEQNFASNNLIQQHNFGEFTITGTTIFPIKAEARLSNGKTISATGQFVVYVEEEVLPPVEPGEVKARLDYYAIPGEGYYVHRDMAIIEMSMTDFNNDKPTQVNIEMNGTMSTSTPHPIDEYRHALRKQDMPWGSEHAFSGEWGKDANRIIAMTFRPSDINTSNNMVEMEGRLGVRDTKRNQNYDYKDYEVVEFRVVAAPPETKLFLPDFFYPKQVTELNPMIKNTIGWDYHSKDNVPYKNSIVSLYKLDEGEEVVFENKIQTERQLVVEGLPEEEYRIVVSVVDELGNVSEKAIEDYIYINPSPKIRINLDTSKEDESLLGILVENITPTEIESIFPTYYTSWEILDINGNSLQNGTGKAPAWVDIDERYIGTVTTVIQYAENILQNKAHDKAFYVNDSRIDFIIDPDRLFETEMAQIIDLTRAINNKTWTISKQTPVSYEPLILNDSLQFTKDKGKYIVKLEGDGNFGILRSRYQYSNKRSNLRGEPPILTDSKIKELFGENSKLVVKSEKWFQENIEEGNYQFEGQNYKYRRQFSYMTLDIARLDRTRPVEFLNAEPNAEFDIISDLGLFLGIDIDNSKEYKKITVDGRASIDATDQELQEKYPILFNHPRTQIKIEPIKGIGGEVDADANTNVINNQLIKGFGSNVVDTAEGKRFVLEGSEAYPADQRAFRIDLNGNYRISYKVWNGLKESKWATKDINVSPELLPSLDIRVTPQPTAYRNPDNDLMTEITVIADYNVNPFEEPLDTIHPDDVIFYIHYDEDGNFSNGIESSQWIRRDSQNIADYITIKERSFGANQAKIVLLIDNEEKNLFGHFKFEVEVKETPTIPNYEEPPTIPLVDVIKVNTGNLSDEKKRTFVDNRKPVIHLSTKRKETVELWIIETDTEGEIDTQEIINQLNLQDVKVEIHIIKADGSIEIRNN